MKGKVVWFNDDKGYGIIESEEGESFLAQSTEIKEARSKKTPKTKLKENATVEFSVGSESSHLHMPRAKNIAEL